MTSIMYFCSQLCFSLSLALYLFSAHAIAASPDDKTKKDQTATQSTSNDKATTTNTDKKMAKTCDMEVTANDAMQFNTKELKIPADCTNLKLTFKNIGKLPKTAMGHNLVIAEKSKTDDLIKAGLQAGANKDYIPNSPDVLASTKLLSGGESDVIEIDVNTLRGKDLNFFCLFPGHTAAMRGSVVFENTPSQSTS